MNLVSASVSFRQFTSLGGIYEDSGADDDYESDNRLEEYPRHIRRWLQAQGEQFAFQSLLSISATQTNFTNECMGFAEWGPKSVIT